MGSEDGVEDAIDVHCHIIETASTRNQIQDTNIAKVILMGTRMEDWPLVAEMYINNSNKIIAAFGVHPWFCTSILASQDKEEWVNVLRKYLTDHPKAIVGEIGLDGVAKDRTTNQLYDYDAQERVFATQMQVAVELERPVSVHSVQIHGKMLDFFKQMDKRCGRVKSTWRKDRFASEDGIRGPAMMLTLPCPPAIMMHSFSGSVEMANCLLKLPHIGSRFYFSFSAVVNGRSNKFEQRIKAIPDDRLLLESDVHDVSQVTVGMASVCRTISHAKDWSFQETIARTVRNTERFLSTIR